MTFVCEKCGNIFESGEERKGYEEDGREWSGCPLCGGDYHEARICHRCLKWTAVDELSWDGYCEDCGNELRAELRYKPLDIVKLTDVLDEKRACYLNPALLWFFSEEQIETILTETLKQASEIALVDCYDYLDQCDAKILHDWEENGESES